MALPEVVENELFNINEALNDIIIMRGLLTSLYEEPNPNVSTFIMLSTINKIVYGTVLCDDLDFAIGTLQVARSNLQQYFDSLAPNALPEGEIE